jgi:hypothetical protein
MITMLFDFDGMGIVIGVSRSNRSAPVIEPLLVQSSENSGAQSGPEVLRQINHEGEERGQRRLRA